MKTTTPLLTRLAMLLAAIAAMNAFAHSVWIETTDDGKLVVRFGEFGAKYEKSPGHLDSLQAVTAWTHDAEGKPAPFAVEKKTDHFLMVDAKAGAPAQIETGFPVMGTKSPLRKPAFYARWHPYGTPVPTLPALTLDIVPTGKPGEVKVLFRGEPVPGAKVTVGFPDETEREFTTDANGVATFPVEQKGLYLVTYPHHRESVPGFAGGRAYDQLSHNGALSWVQP